MQKPHSTIILKGPLNPHRAIQKCQVVIPCDKIIKKYIAETEVLMKQIQRKSPFNHQGLKKIKRLK